MIFRTMRFRMIRVRRTIGLISFNCSTKKNVIMNMKIYTCSIIIGITRFVGYRKRYFRTLYTLRNDPICGHLRLYLGDGIKLEYC